MGPVRLDITGCSRGGVACALAVALAITVGCGQSPCSWGQDAGQPHAVISTDQYVLHRASAAANPAHLRASVVGGRRPFTYVWSVADPSGEGATELLTNDQGASIAFTPGELDGPYEISCTLTDVCGRTDDARILLTVGSDIGLAITTERFGVVAGGGTSGQTTIRINPSSGQPPFDIEWTCTGPDGRIDSQRLDTTDPLAPIFTSSDLIGVYTLTASITDTWGATSVESAMVVVGQILGLDVISERTTVLPGGGRSGMVTLLATPIGGVAPYTYDWEVIGSDGDTHNDLLWDTAVRSPVFESDDETGVYVARCAVTDSDGTVLIGSTTITVGQQISIDVNADRLALPAASAATATLSADVRGGRDPVDVNWTVIQPDGTSSLDLLSADKGTQTTMSAGSTSGVYVVRASATDADGLSATDSVVITVGGSVGVTVSAPRTSLATGGRGTYGQVQLEAQPYGGQSPYLYDWSVVDPFGLTDNSLLSDTTTQKPSFISGSVTGLHNITCTVTDASGDVAVSAIGISVGQPLNADVTVDKQSVVAGGGVGGQAQLISTVNGGVSPYTYVWSVSDPNGGSGGSRLTDVGAPQPVFTSDSTTGTYSLTLTTTDVTGVVFVDSVEIVVGGEAASGQDLSMDATIDRQTVAPSGGTASLTASVAGGLPPVTYNWRVTDPSGNLDNARLNDTTSATPTFTSTTVQGTYRAVCTVTDAVGNTFTDSVQLTVSDEFTVDLSGDATNLGPGGAVTLVADRTGGEANFTYTWTGVDDSGAPAGTFSTGATGPGAATQTGADDATNSWTAPPAAVGTLGTYRITVVATDANGKNFTDSVMITITDAFLMELSASVMTLAPGGAATLTANRTGGSPNFTYTWRCVDSTDAPAGSFTTGSTGPGAATQIGADDTTNVWTAPAAGAGTLGTYRITVQVAEASGNSFEDTIHVLVVDPFSIDLTAADNAIAPSASTLLTANRTGGETTFTYVWAAQDATGALAGSFSTGSTGVGEATQAGEADDATNTFTAPAGVTTCTISCTATDTLGSSYTDSTTVFVGQEPVLTLDVTSDKYVIAPTESVTLTVNQTGGATPFDYTYTALDESGAAGGTLGAASQTDVAGDTTNTWTAPAAGAGTLGSYRLFVTATDDDGVSFTDSVAVVVDAPLTMDLSASGVYVAPSTNVTLVANQTGGEPNYTYVWTAASSAGGAAGTFTTGSTGVGAATQANEGSDATNQWSIATEDSYTITCTVTGNNGQVFTDSVFVIVTTQDVMSLDVSADVRVIAPGETINLAGDRTGGSANFTYTWTAVNEASVVSGTLGSASQSGVANDTTNTWTAPTGTNVDGTYRITCILTDSTGRTCTDSLAVEVTSQATQNILLAPPAAATNSVLAGLPLTIFSLLADPGQQIAAGFTNPAYPRNIVITITDADNSITGGTARVTGTDARGMAQSEVIAIAASAGASSTNTGVVPFATVTRVDLYAFNGTGAGIDQVRIGVGSKFGLTGLLDQAADVLYVLEDTTLMTAGYTVDATAGQQGITFSNAPNGTRNYTVVFRAR